MTLITLPSLLLIASHPQFIYLIQRYGERSGCRVISAESVDTALALMGREQPAMVLLHLMAWPHDDWHMLRRLREHSVDSSIPITVISAMADEARARDEGAAYWLWQPVMFADFRAALIATGVLQDSAGLQPAELRIEHKE